MSEEILPAAADQIKKWDEMARDFMRAGDTYSSYNLHLIIRRLAASIRQLGDAGEATCERLKNASVRIAALEQENARLAQELKVHQEGERSLVESTYIFQKERDQARAENQELHERLKEAGLNG